MDAPPLAPEGVPIEKGEVPRQTAARDSALLRPLTTHPCRGPLSSRDDVQLRASRTEGASRVKRSDTNNKGRCSRCGCGACQSRRFMGLASASLGSAADFEYKAEP